MYIIPHARLHGRKPATARHRVDTTAKAIMAEAKRLGLGVLPLGGVIDAALFLGRVVALVDFKSPGAGLTEGQGRALALGCPINFLSTTSQLEMLARDMKRRARDGE